MRAQLLIAGLLSAGLLTGCSLGLSPYKAPDTGEGGGTTNTDGGGGLPGGPGADNDTDAGSGGPGNPGGPGADDTGATGPGGGPGSDDTGGGPGGDDTGPTGPGGSDDGGPGGPGTDDTGGGPGGPGSSDGGGPGADTSPPVDTEPPPPFAACADDDLGGAIGAAVSSGNTSGMGNDHTPTCTASSTAHDLAFAWTPSDDGCYQFDTQGSAFDTVLYVQEDCAGFSVLDCNDDTTGTQSVVILSVDADQPVLVVVDGYGSYAGSYTLNVVDHPGTGFNAAANVDVDLGTATGTVDTGTNAGASTAVTACENSSDVLVFAWTAPSTSTYTFDTNGSNFDTVLTLWTQEDHCGADEDTCDDDGGAGLKSRLTKSVFSGDTVYLSLAGYRGDTGAYVLNIN